MPIKQEFRVGFQRDWSDGFSMSIDRIAVDVLQEPAFAPFSLCVAICDYCLFRLRRKLPLESIAFDFQRNECSIYLRFTAIQLQS
jgi:hypothetical protein